jgi:hypothetical protein
MTRRSGDQDWRLQFEASECLPCCGHPTLAIGCVKSLAVLITAFGLIAVTGCSSPSSSRENLRSSLSCVPPAFRIFGARTTPPKELPTAVPAAISSNFAIFRRPTVKSDEPFVANADRKLARELYRDYELVSFYPAYVRQLRTPFAGHRYFVIPAYGRPEAVPPAHCMTAAERRELLAQQHRRSIEPVYCIIEIGGDKNASPHGCEPFAAIDEGGGLFQPGSPNGKPILELVPDGAATVRIVYRVHHPIVVRARENTLLFTPPPLAYRVNTDLKKLEHKLVDAHVSQAQRRHTTLLWDKTLAEGAATKIEWLDKAGRTVRTIGAPLSLNKSPTSVGNLLAPIGG